MGRGGWSCGREEQSAPETPPQCTVIVASEINSSLFKGFYSKIGKGNCNGFIAAMVGQL